MVRLESHDCGQHSNDHNKQDATRFRPENPGDRYCLGIVHPRTVVVATASIDHGYTCPTLPYSDDLAELSLGYSELAKQHSCGHDAWD